MDDVALMCERFFIGEEGAQDASSATPSVVTDSEVDFPTLGSDSRDFDWQVCDGYGNGGYGKEDKHGSSAGYGDGCGTEIGRATARRTTATIAAGTTPAATATARSLQ